MQHLRLDQLEGLPEQAREPQHLQRLVQEELPLRAGRLLAQCVQARRTLYQAVQLGSERQLTDIVSPLQDVTGPTRAPGAAQQEAGPDRFVLQFLLLLRLLRNFCAEGEAAARQLHTAGVAMNISRLLASAQTSKGAHMFCVVLL